MVYLLKDVSQCRHSGKEKNLEQKMFLFNGLRVSIPLSQQRKESMTKEVFGKTSSLNAALAAKERIKKMKKFNWSLFCLNAALAAKERIVDVLPSHSSQVSQCRSRSKGKNRVCEKEGGGDDVSMPLSQQRKESNS